MNTEPVVRISKGYFAPEQYDTVRALIDASAGPLVPALEELRGLLYYVASVDPATNTVVNVSIWSDLVAAKRGKRLGHDAEDHTGPPGPPGAPGEWNYLARVRFF